MYVTQVLQLISSFTEGNAPDEVIIRVVCIVFNHIVDLENFGDVMAEVSFEIKLELIHRLGVLNVWSCMKPGEKVVIKNYSTSPLIRPLDILCKPAIGPSPSDGLFELDLAARDHREAFKLILRLAAIEPGENVRLRLSYSSHRQSHSLLVHAADQGSRIRHFIFGTLQDRLVHTGHVDGA